MKGREIIRWMDNSEDVTNNVVIREMAATQIPETRQGNGLRPEILTTAMPEGVTLLNVVTQEEITDPEALVLAMIAATRILIMQQIR